MGQVREKELSAGEMCWSTSRGELRVRAKADTLILVQLAGYFEPALVPYVKAPIERAVAAGHRPVVFHDWWEMTGYDSDTRLMMTKWTLDVRQRLASVHILLRSRIVAMGVSVANLTLGGYLKVYDSRPPFDASLSDQMKKQGVVA